MFLESVGSVLAALRTPVALVLPDGHVELNLAFRTLVGVAPASDVNAWPRLAAALTGLARSDAEGVVDLPVDPVGVVRVSYTRSALDAPGLRGILLQLDNPQSSTMIEGPGDDAETQFKLLAHAAPIGIWDQNRLTDEWYFSPKVHALLDLPMDCATDPRTLFQQLVLPEDLPLIRLRTAAAFRNRTLYDSTFRIRLPDGEIRTLKATGLSAHLPDGRVARFVGTLQLASDALEARPGLQLDTVPLSIRNSEGPSKAPEQAGSKPGPGTVGEHHGVALADLSARSDRPFLGIMDDLIELSGLQAGAKLVEPATFNVLETLTAATEHLCGRDACPVSLIIDPRANAEFIGQAGVWRRVVQTMLGHAMSRSSYQGVEARLTVGENGHGLLVEVQDTGNVASSAALSQLFVLPDGADMCNGPDPGWRIGLTLARLLARQMGGELGLTGLARGGAIARLYVPFERSASVAVVPDTANDSCVLERPVRVLVAEDNPANQRVISIILQQLGCEVSIAENGHVCVAMFAQDHYDLVMMDLHMPVMDGYTATRIIRSSGPKGQSALIVAVTADARTEAQTDALAAGVDDFLTKPVVPARIAEIVARAIDWPGSSTDGLSRSA
jgi:hypothetical protein